MGANGIQATTLSGNFEFVPGSANESGSFTAQCAVNGSSQLQFQGFSGPPTETRQTSNGIPSGNWIDNQGVTHPMAGHNVLTPASWFCPHIVLASFLQSQNLNIQLIGLETKNGGSVVHLSVAAIVPDNSPSSVLTAHLSQTDVYLDSATFRPVAVDFNIHPDNSATTDMPVEIQFSNYTNASGVWIPYQVVKVVNSVVALQLQVESASTSGTVPQTSSSRSLHNGDFR
jgi:hypothetical protein